MQRTPTSPIWGELSQSICRNCGTRHFANSRQNRICTAAVKTTDWRASAAGVAELAAAARSEADFAFRAYAAKVAAGEGDTPRATRWHRNAMDLFAKAYEIEN